MSKEFTINSKVRVTSLPAYVKTADTMPMLRPADVISIGEEGIVLDRRPGEYWVVKFTKNTYLLESQYLETVTDTP